VPLRDFEKWHAEHPPAVSTLFVGTEDQWSAIEQSLSLENRVSLVDHFEKVYLESPEVSTLIDVAMRMISTGEISAIGYAYEYQGMTGERARHQLMAYLINRAHYYAQEQGRDKTLALTQTLTELTMMMSKDTELRKSKVVDLKAIKRLLTKIFNLPLDINDLPENDPLRRLYDFRRISLELEDPKYNSNPPYYGPLSMRHKMIQAISLHLRERNSTLNVPSSMIIYGDTSTGKSLFFLKLIEVLGLKLYDFNNPMDQGAQALIIPCKTIVESDNDSKEDKKEKETKKSYKKATGSMTAEDVIDHIQNFLSLPNGYRGLVLLDDLHNAPEGARSKILAYLSSIFEAKNGKILVSPLNSEDTREIPVRNIMMGMTINPPSDPEKLKKFGSSPSDVQMVVASLSSAKVPVESSFVQRWGTILRLEKFPSEAKKPALQAALRKNARSEYTSSGTFMIVDPDTVDATVKNFPDVNARAFLPKAVTSILELGKLISDESTFRMIMPKSENLRGSLAEKSSLFSTSDNITAYVYNSATAMPLDGTGSAHMNARLAFVSFMASSFRALVYGRLATEITSLESQHRGTLDLRGTYFAPLLSALTFHLNEVPKMHLKQFSLDVGDFGYQYSSKPHFRESFEGAINSDRGYLPKYNPSIPHHYPSQSIDEFLEDKIKDAAVIQTRRKILTSTVHQLTEVINEYFNKFMRIKNIKDFENPSAWIGNLETNDVEALKSLVGKQMMKVFDGYLREMIQESVFENTSKNHSRLDMYDYMRLFALVTDQAIANQLWMKASGGLVNAVQFASRDSELSQSAGFIFYLFESQMSPFLAADIDRVKQTLASAQSIEGYKLHEALAGSYAQKCDSFLTREDL
jgi:hypothetical protein